MPFSSVRLIPGVNVERTATLLEAGYSQSQLIRFKDSLGQKYGGWQKFYDLTVSGIPRDMHAWEDLNSVTHLAVGTTTELGVITSGNINVITPQTFTSDFAPNFSTVISTNVVTVLDTNIGTLSVYDSVLFQTPISVGGIIISGLYPIHSVLGATLYTIIADTATATVNNGGAVPVFTTAITDSAVIVTLNNHGLSIGGHIAFGVPTTANGVTISGLYTVATVTSANAFTIAASNQATASGSFSMNAGLADAVYYINIGPQAVGSGFGIGPFGAGGFGTGSTTTAQTGTPITAVDWTSDNWGQILIAVPQNGGVYAFDPTGGFANAGLVATAPPINGGGFISNAQQILILWASSVEYDIGVQQDPMTVNWSASGDYTNFVVSSTTQAGSFRIPIGSTIRGGMAVQNQNLIWTDLDLWAMNYIGLPFVYGFNKIGSGCGLIGSHAAQQVRGGVYWMGPTNFYQYAGSGVQVIPCPVWDAVFQNLNTANSYKVRAMPNTPFNEVGWEYPSLNATENDSYIKFNITEPGGPWDYGLLARSAWIDQTVLGMPIGATTGGIIYQHETTPDDDGAPLTASFTTGYFMIGDGEDFAYVDQIIPDFKFGPYGGNHSAQIQLTFNLINYPGDTPISYGPYTFMGTTQYIPVGLRGRQMSITVQSSDVGSWWRLGRVRYRWRPDGRA
jgi:hypothetical protein